MGNQISSTASSPPFAAAGTIISFITFAFSFLTLLRLFWDNINTVMNANKEVEDTLGLLKQSLYEERNHLRAAPRRCQSQYEEGSFRILAENVSDMIKDFKQLEEPFLFNPGDDYDEKPCAVDLADSDDYFDLRYRKMSLAARVVWIREKDVAFNLSTKLSRLQTRRISRQTNDIAIASYHALEELNDLEQRVKAIEQKLVRVVGVRRVD